MYPQGVCRIRMPAYAGNGCAIFPAFDTEEWAKKIRSQSQTIYSEVPYKDITLSRRMQAADFVKNRKGCLYGSPMCILSAPDPVVGEFLVPLVRGFPHAGDVGIHMLPENFLVQ